MLSPPPPPGDTPDFSSPKSLPKLTQQPPESLVWLNLVGGRGGGEREGEGTEFSRV